MRYDGFDRLRCWLFPSKSQAGELAGNCDAYSGDFETYGYDAVGNRTTHRRRNGSILGFQYDGLNRLIRKIVPERPDLTYAQTRDVFYDYDFRGLQTVARFDGLAGEGFGWDYDGFGRQARVRSTMGGVARDLTYAYYPDGSRERITHPDGAAFGYLNDALGRVTQHYQINAAPGIDDHVVRYWYNGAGNRHGVVRGAGAIGFYTIYYRDPVERPVIVANDFPLAADMAIELACNPAGQVTTRSVSNDSYAAPPAYNVGRAYQVNGLNQYTGTSNGGVSNWSFDYDWPGNLTRAVDPAGLETTAYRYDDKCGRRRALRPSHAATALIKGRRTRGTRIDMAAEGEIDKEVVTHRKGYEGFIFLMKWSAVVCVVVALIVILLISE